MATESRKDQLERIVDIMRKWQKFENAAIAQTARVMNQTEHPLIRLVMEIIQRDSNTHYRVQQMIIDTVERGLAVKVEDIAEVWDAIEDHIRLEKRAHDAAQEALAALGSAGNPVERYLLNYLLDDEAKHDRLLEALDLIKRGLYP